MQVVEFRVLPTEAGPFGIFNLFSRHRWYCTKLDCYINMRPIGARNVPGTLIVRDDDGIVRHLGVPSESDALIETKSGLINAWSVASAYGMRLARSLRQSILSTDC